MALAPVTVSVPVAVAVRKIQALVPLTHVNPRSPFYVIICGAPYERFACKYKKPIVVAGSEPPDVRQSALTKVLLINALSGDFAAGSHEFKPTTKYPRELVFLPVWL